VNTKLFLCIAMGVFVAHLAVFMIVARIRLDRLPPPVPVAKPNFSVSEAVDVNPATGEKIVHREITISTKLVEPEAPLGRTKAPAER
jgi:hypothetical protein